VSARVALVFPGQGSQRIGMLDDVPELDALGRLLDAAEALSGFDLRSIASQGTPEDLADTRVAQPLLYLCDWAWGITLIESGVEPVALAGHSLGELAALAVAEVYSPEAGLELVVERSRYMAQAAAASPGTMSAVLGLEAPAIMDAVADVAGVWVANDNSAGQVVISGTTDGVALATAALEEAGARRIVPLPVSGAFHSPLMTEAADRFADLLSEAEFESARYPVLSNVDPVPSTDAEVLRSHLMAQIVSPVRWTETMAALASEGPITIIEAGPGAVLTGLAKRLDSVTAVAVESAGLEAAIEEVL
jgi:[acyl-carrier-protein] S-malonyltransferase